MVDDKKIGMTPAVELSFLKPHEQKMLLDTIESEQATPSLSQAKRMKDMSRLGMLTDDNVIIGRVVELAEKYGVSMTEISLAWLLTKVTSPVVGATKLHHIEGAAKAVDLTLAAEDIAYLEEPYVPHPLAGVMAQNRPANAKGKHVWSTDDQKIREKN